jgi:hypothetical protein
MSSDANAASRRWIQGRTSCTAAYSQADCAEPVSGTASGWTGCGRICTGCRNLHDYRGQGAPGANHPFLAGFYPSPSPGPSRIVHFCTSPVRKLISRNCHASGMQSDPDTIESPPPPIDRPHARLTSKISGLLSRTTIASVVAAIVILAATGYAIYTRDTNLVTFLAGAGIGYLFARKTTQAGQ